MTSNLSAIKTKISALLAKAEGTDNEFEAATFMAKVNELMERYQIERHELGDETDAMGHQRGDFNFYASMTWAKLLIGQVARFYGTNLVTWKLGNHFKYDVIGRESARVTTELMIPFIVTQVRQKAGMMARDTGKTRAICEREIGQALALRLHNEVQKDAARRAEHAKNALIPVNENESYMKATYSDLKTAKAKTIRTSATARDHADKISIRHQAPNAAGTKLLG
jgi:hypothetical protein